MGKLFEPPENVRRKTLKEVPAFKLNNNTVIVILRRDLLPHLTFVTLSEEEKRRNDAMDELSEE